MKKLLAAATAIVALAATGSVWAADLPPPQVFKAPPPPPWYDWTGFYIGGNGGYSWGRGATNYAVAGRAPFSTTQAINGGLGGGQIGYNWQFNHNWLLGIEADFQGTGERGGSGLPTIVIPPIIGAAVVPGSTTTANLSQSLPWFGTVRGRVGVEPVDRWLLYATGGLAYGQLNSTLGSTTTTTGGVVTAASSSANVTRAGWTVGAGVEWAFLNRWSAKLEYIYMDLGTFNLTFPGTGPYATVVTSTHFTDNIVRAGINYSFGGPHY
jgi:outer membrane immunogenic protein